MSALELIPISQAPEDWVPQWVIENIWQQNGLNFVAGPPKRGRKSSLRRYLTACALTGAPAFGRFKANKVERILSFIVEDHPGMERKALSKAISTLGYDVDPIIKQDRIVYATSPFIDLCGKQWRTEIADELNAGGYNFVTLDPLIEFHAGDENSAQDMGAVARVLRRITDKCGVAVTHHTGKGGKESKDWGSVDTRTTGERMRGSTVMPGAANVSILSSPYQSSPVLNELQFEIKTPANGIEPDPLVAKCDYDTWVWHEQLTLNEVNVCQVLGNNPGMTRADLRAHFNCKSSEVTKIVQELLDGNMITDHGKRGGLTCP
jgi:hypothetical protein